MTEKKQPRKSLTTQLDGEWSRYVRLREADPLGRVKCATCDSVKDWREMQVGHFVSRRHFVHRWEIRNCAPQCPRCNRFDQGRQWALGQWLDDRHGPGTAATMWESRNMSAPVSEREELLRVQLAKWRTVVRDRITNVAATQLAAAKHAATS